jgi:hypothetical protein
LEFWPVIQYSIKLLCFVRSLRASTFGSFSRTASRRRSKLLLDLESHSIGTWTF